MSRMSTKICGQCQCRFGDGDCIHFSGQGTTDDPYVPEIVIDPVDGNLIDCGPAGLAAFLEPIYLDPPACNIYATIDQTVPWDTAWPLLFNQSRYDTDSMHDKENEPSRITFKTPGLYLVTFNIRWNKTNDSTATGDLAAFIRLNGSDFIALDSFPVPGGDSYAKHSLSVQVPAVAGDYVEVVVKQDIVIDDEPVPLRVTTERMSPIFAAVFLRPIQAMDILGVPSSSPTLGEGGGGVGTQYTLDGTQWWQTDDHASLDITGDIDIRVAGTATDWTPATDKAILSKWTGVGGGRSYRMGLIGAIFFPQLTTSNDGTSSVTAASTAFVPSADGTITALRVTRDVDDGGGNRVTTFYTKTTTPATALADCESNSGWSLLGTAVTEAGTTSIFSSAANLSIGAFNVDTSPANFWLGDIYAAVVKNGINGTTVANPDFYHNNSPFTDGSGRTWVKFP